VWAEHGRAALAVLRGEDPTRKVTTPVVVLLDLNMPVMNGFEFLAELRHDPLLHDTVVFVLTTSASDLDRTRAYDHVIAGYLVKSALGPQFAKLARLLGSMAETVAFPERRV
jgi:CheY-like chemotaxis protein